MNAQKLVQRLSDLKLDSAIRAVLGEAKNIREYSRVVWGAGVSGRNFVQTYSNLDFDYIVDTREALQGQNIAGIPVLDPSRLFKENPERVIVFLPTVIHQKISTELRSRDFRNIVIPNQFNTSGIGLGVNRSEVDDVFRWLEEHSIKYVFLKAIPDSFANSKDIDLLVDLSSLEKLMDCPFLISQPGDDTIYFDISLSAPIGLNGELPFFPRDLARHFLSDESSILINGIRSLKPIPLLHAYAYHIVVHKGTEVALSKSLPQLRRLAHQLHEPLELSLDGLWGFLLSQPYPPAIDLTRKWAAHNQSKFLATVTQITAEQPSSRAVFIFRDFLSRHPETFAGVRKLIEEEGMEEESLVILGPQRAEKVRHQVRGGIWEDSYQSRLGGGPYALGVYRTKGKPVRTLKERLRSYVEESCGVEVNAIHSSDDDTEASEYIRFVNEHTQDD